MSEITGEGLEGFPRTAAEAEARYRLLAENSTDVISVTDATGVIRYVSPACRTMSGWEPEEMVGRSAYDFIHPDDVGGLAEVHATMLDDDSAELHPPPHRTRCKDGAYIWIESVVRAIRDPDSREIVEMHAATRDVTAWIEAQQRLERSERMLAHAQRLSRIGSWEWDVRTGTVTWSDELYEIFGVGRDEFVPSYAGYLERVHEHDRERVRKFVEEARATGSSLDYRCRVMLPSGETRTVEARGEAVREEGETVLIRGTVQDITERQRAAAELAKMHKELEAKTSELERSNLELEQFAYDASHDLVEPLRLMSRLAQAFAEEYGGELDDRGRQFVTSILDGTERMRLLISDLLEYSRVSREPLERSWVNGQRALEEAMELLSESIAEKEAELTWDSLPTIEAHPAQLRQLLQNLLSNALKFAGEEPLRVHVGAQRRDGGWEISVTDNGIGVDPHQAQRVFELFRRLGSSDVYAGTGMGLSICKRIVERHGGRIWVESAEGQGSVFRFTIPDQPTGLETLLSSESTER